MNRLKELQGEHNTAATEARALLDMVEKEKRGLTVDEQVKWDKLTDDICGIKEKIKREEFIANEERELKMTNGVKIGAFDTDAKMKTSPAGDEKRAFENYIRRGKRGMSQEDRDILDGKIASLSPDEARALTLTTTAGGYTVPQDFLRRLEDAMLPFSGMRQAGATILQTENGASLPMPSANDTTNTGVIVTVNTQIASSGADPTFGQVVLGAHMFSSRIVLVPIQLLQDAFFDIGGWLAAKLGERIGRATNAYFTTGAGTTEPSGVVTGAALGKTGAGGQTTTVTYLDLVDLLHSVNTAYRPVSKFMFADTTLKAIKKLLDGQQRPLWSPDLIAGAPASILGHQYIVNDDVAAMAASAKSILFGDFSKYHIRDVTGGGVGLVEFREKYMDALQVGFMAFSRHDGALLDAGTNPMKYYQNAAS